MIRKYGTLLPAYLDGRNIRKHANIIEQEDNLLENNMNLLRDWNNIERPILIERVSNELYMADMTVHVNVNECIRKIIITAKSTQTAHITFPEANENNTLIKEYPLEEIKISETFTLTVEDSETPLVMPEITVTVETHDGHTYNKGYPENDITQTDIYDHDEFLDKIGALYGIPRRVYCDWTGDEGTIEELLPQTVPTCFAKYDNEENIIAGTEDDWYYQQRLYYFIQHYRSMDLAQLYLYLIYNIELQISHEYEEYEIQQGNYLYILDKNTRFAVNIDEPPLGQELSADPYLARFIPVTREAYVLKDQTLYKIKKCIMYSSGWNFVVVTDMYDNPISDMTFDTRTTLHGTVTTNTNGEILICGDTLTPDYENVIWIYPLDISYVPQTRDYSYQAAEELVITDIVVIDRGTPLRMTARYNYCDVGCDSILRNLWCPRERQYFVSIPTPIGNVMNSEGIIFYVDETEEYKCPFKINEQMVTRLYVTPDSVCALNDLTILRTWNFTDDFTLGVYAEENNFHFQGFPHVYLSGDVPVIPVTITEYGLGTDNPWTADNTQYAILPSDKPGYLATNYTKQSTGTIINIPLVGDFEIELKCNVNMNQGTGYFALYDGQSNVLEVNMNNTLNGSSINTVFPNPSAYVDTETFTLSRSGTTYTYKHGNETRTLTINNTNPLYLKMRKTGNGDMFISTMSVTGGGQ